MQDRFRTTAQLRAWLETLSDDQLATISEAADLCRELVVDADAFEDRMDALYVHADGVGDERFRAREAERELRCIACGGPNEDGEGWEGRCGNCADRAECASRVDITEPMQVLSVKRHGKVVTVEAIADANGRDVMVHLCVDTIAPDLARRQQLVTRGTPDGSYCQAYYAERLPGDTGELEVWITPAAMAPLWAALPSR